MDSTDGGGDWPRTTCRMRTPEWYYEHLRPELADDSQHALQDRGQPDGWLNERDVVRQERPTEQSEITPENLHAHESLSYLPENVLYEWSDSLSLCGFHEFEDIEQVPRNQRGRQLQRFASWWVQ